MDFGVDSKQKKTSMTIGRLTATLVASLVLHANADAI